MSGSERLLVRHLALIVLIKLALLGVLWWAFVRVPASAPVNSKDGSNVVTSTSSGEQK